MGDDLDGEAVEINAGAAATTRDLTDEERAELEQLEQRRLPFGFQPPGAQS